MTYQTIDIHTQDTIATITLNRPAVYNALSVRMYGELLDAIARAERDETVRCLVITGAGKGFCSGADLVELQSLLNEGLSVSEALRQGLNQLILALRSLPKPVVCGLNGVAAGAGASLALACDYRVASSDASLVFAAFASIGIIPDGGLTYLLRDLVGSARAMDLLTHADADHRLGADAALGLGIVNALTTPAAFTDDLYSYAARLSQMATIAIGQTKRAVYQAATTTLADALEHEARTQGDMFKTADFLEGVQAFIERRNAHFIGR
jgi:2-(1,2-epoxy-1,2-dihydrophenyl)acetyl-CoA isomerase